MYKTGHYRTGCLYGTRQTRVMLPVLAFKHFRGHPGCASFVVGHVRLDVAGRPEVAYLQHRPAGYEQQAGERQTKEMAVLNGNGERFARWSNKQAIALKVRETKTCGYFAKLRRCNRLRPCEQKSLMVWRSNSIKSTLKCPGLLNPNTAAKQHFNEHTLKISQRGANVLHKLKALQAHTIPT